MHVNFVTASNENMASYRMRVDIPAFLLNNSPYQDSGEMWDATITQVPAINADINCFSKHFRPEFDQHGIETCDTKTLFDVCDDHFDREHGAHYEFMCQAADVVTCNTEAMQERIYDVTGKLARIVSDPITFDKGNFEYHKKPKILWFGHRVNLPSLSPYWRELENLTIITNVKIKDTPSHVKTKMWKPGLVEETIQDYDIVILPKNKNPEAVYKSPNRAVDSIYSGKYVVTDFNEVYENLSPFCFLGDIFEGIDFYKNNPEECKRQVLAGQKYVNKNYNDKIITKQWEKAILSDGE